MENSSFFAAPDLTSHDDLGKEIEFLNSNFFFTQVFGTIAGIGAVVDKNRQIIYANQEFLNLLGLNSLEPILGKRPGEVVACVHSSETDSGCGTAKACAFCGAVNSILECQITGKKSQRETHITSVIDGKHKSWDFNVITSPLVYKNSTYYMLVLQDISSEKRRVALEKIFFHDLLNSAGSLNGLLSIIAEDPNHHEVGELISLSEKISKNIVDEILVQRQLRAAENDDLKLNIEHSNSLEILNSAIDQISYHEAARNKRIELSGECINCDIETDRSLLERVIINLLKNAIEASPVNGVIRTGVTQKGEKINFWVKNDQVIREEVQLQIFQRSFSTKGEGRGLGTYSIRLLTENFLGGKASFISNEKDGTVFNIELNKMFPSDEKHLK